MLKYTNQIIVFIIELIMIGSLGYFGFQKGSSALTKYTLAIILPTIAILLWAYFAAPKSTHRLTMPYLAIFRGIFFLTASYLLYKCNQTGIAVVVAFLSILTQVTSYYFGD